MKQHFSLILMASLAITVMTTLFGCASLPSEEQMEPSVIEGPAFVLFYADN